MTHRNFTSVFANDTAIDATQLGLSLTSPFTYSLSIADPDMIKQAVPQRPQGLTKLQHRLLYETESDSSLDLSFSSPSSIGSTSVYSDVASIKSRASSHGPGRRTRGHGSRSESISSVLGSSLAIQRVLMGNNPPSSTHRNTRRQSVRAIASAFEEAGKSSTMVVPKRIGSQLGRVDEMQAPTTANSTRQQTATGSAVHPYASLSTRPSDSQLGRSAGVHATMPARLKISSQPVKGPLSAPVALTPQALQSSSLLSDMRESSIDQPQFVLPPRTSSQRGWQLGESQIGVRGEIRQDDQFDDDEDEPLFEIIPSPTRKRSSAFLAGIRAPRATFPHPEEHSWPSSSTSTSTSTSGADSPPMASSRSSTSRNSIDSTYSNDSLSGHPFSLQVEDDHDPRASSTASMFDLDEIDNFRSTFIDNSSTDFMYPHGSARGEPRHEVEILPATLNMPAEAIRASTSTLKPLVLPNSRSSSTSSTKTLTPSPAAAPAPASMRVNDDTLFPLPPFTTAASVKPNLAKIETVTAGKDSLTSSPDQNLAIAELKREAQSLLDSIRSLGEEIDNSIPPTHRLPGSAYRSASKPSSPTSDVSPSKAEQAAFVAVDTSYSDVWRVMDSWYWSSFEIGPPMTYS